MANSRETEAPVAIILKRVYAFILENLLWRKNLSQWQEVQKRLPSCYGEMIPGVTSIPFVEMLDPGLCHICYLLDSKDEAAKVQSRNLLALSWCWETDAESDLRN